MSQSESSSTGQAPDHRRQELMRLVEAYAFRARELSEAIAALGSHITAGRSFLQTVSEIKRLRVLSTKAGDELLAFIDPQQAGTAALGAGSGSEQEDPSEEAS